jgi:hypothetical protein
MKRIILSGNVFFALWLLCFVSCTEHEQNENEGEKEVPTTAQEWMTMNQQTAVRSLLRQLAGVTDVSEDFDSQTYQPVYGIVRDEAEPFVRAVAVAEAGEAVAAFLALVGCDTLAVSTADGLAVDLTNLHLRADGRIQDFGKLTLHITDDGSERVAWAEVKIACMPSLRRIDYIDEESWGYNGSADATYHYGELCRYEGRDYPEGLYICVEENMPGQKNSGTLVHLEDNEGGAGCSYNLDGDDDGCWKPCHPGTANDVKNYVKMLLGTYVKRTKTYKRNYRNALIRYFSQEDMLKEIWDLRGNVLPLGFREWDGHLYGRDNHPAAIIVDARYGSQSGWLFFGTVREVNYWEIVNWSVSDMGEDKTFYYWKDKEWNNFASSHYVYTMNVVRFGDDPLNGFSVLYTPNPEELW